MPHCYAKTAGKRRPAQAHRGPPQRQRSFPRSSPVRPKPDSTSWCSRNRCWRPGESGQAGV